FEKHLDGIAGADLRPLAGRCKFLEGDATFGFQTHVDDGEVVFDRNDPAPENAAFERGSTAERFIEQGRKTFLLAAGGGIGISHEQSVLSSFCPAGRLYPAVLM